jgi:hypothetical protein
VMTVTRPSISPFTQRKRGSCAMVRFESFILC